MKGHFTVILFLMLPLCSNSLDPSGSRLVTPTSTTQRSEQSFGKITQHTLSEIWSLSNQTDDDTIPSQLSNSKPLHILMFGSFKPRSSNSSTRLCKLYGKMNSVSNNSGAMKCFTPGPKLSLRNPPKGPPLLHAPDLPPLARGTRSTVGDQTDAEGPFPKGSSKLSNSSARGQLSTSQIVAAPKRTIRFPTSMPLESIALPSYLKAVTSIPEELGESPDRLLPELLTPIQSSVTTRAGQTASLTCYVRNLGNRQLTWIRGKDLHVLSSGTVTFASDMRVSVSAEGEAWTLTIRYSQPKDGGQYACQVNTQPPVAVWYNLTVIEARAVIDGKETMYVQAGSNITLKCTVREQLVIPGLVLWYHGEALVARDSSRVSVATTTDRITESILTISSARSSDSGNYSCWPSAGAPDSILLHVIKGEPPAAMQHGHSATLQHDSITTVAVAVVVLLHSLCLQHYNTHSGHKGHSSHNNLNSHSSNSRPSGHISHSSNRGSAAAASKHSPQPGIIPATSPILNLPPRQPPGRYWEGWCRESRWGSKETQVPCGRRCLIGASRRNETSGH